MSDDITTETARVRALLTETRKARTAAQRAAADRGTITMALERTARDRSALSSPDIETERSRVQQLHDELVELYGTVDNFRALHARVKASGHPADFTNLDKALTAEADTRNAREATLASEGADRG